MKKELLKLSFIAAEFALVFWLITGDTWLKFFVAYSISQLTFIGFDALPKIAMLESVTQAMDNQLVIISADLNTMIDTSVDDKEMDRLRYRIEALEDEIKSLRRYPSV